MMHGVGLTFICVFLIQVPYLLSLSYSHLYVDPFLGNEAPKMMLTLLMKTRVNVMEVGFDMRGGD